MTPNPEVICRYCANQGFDTTARLLKDRGGELEEVVAPGTVRYGCPNGHKFALPLPQQRRTA